MASSPTEATPLLRPTPGASPGLTSATHFCGGRTTKWTAVAFLVLCSLITVHFFRASDWPRPPGIASGGSYELSDTSTGLYVRIDRSNNGTLTLSQSFPWLSGSNFKIVHVQDACYKLRSSEGHWVRRTLGVVLADGLDEDNGDCIEFEAHREAGMRLKIVSEGKSRYIMLSASELYVDGVFAVGLLTTERLAEAAVFNVQAVTPLRGVNLGGWFIPEYWMMPSFYANSGLRFNASLCNFVHSHEALAEERITHNIANWITERDIEDIAAIGLNSVRVPIGYWNVINDPYKMFVPKDVSISLRALDWCFDACSRHNISVLIDLHGAPGSQNGLDHSGCQMNSEWTSNYNVRLTLTAIEVIAKRYSAHKSFLGIEVLNEPSYVIEQLNRTVLVDFYNAAYRVIRRNSDTAVVVFNDIYSDFYDSWNQILQEPAFYNVALDLHLYDWQEPYTFETAEQHIADAVGWQSTIERLSLTHPIIIGEWSYSTGTLMSVGQAFVNATLDSFKSASGWYIWTWKVEKDVGFDIWNVHLQSKLQNGIRLFL